MKNKLYIYTQTPASGAHRFDRDTGYKIMAIIDDHWHYISTTFRAPSLCSEKYNYYASFRTAPSLAPTFCTLKKMGGHSSIYKVINKIYLPYLCGYDVPRIANIDKIKIITIMFRELFKRGVFKEGAIVKQIMVKGFHQSAFSPVVMVNI